MPIVLFFLFSKDKPDNIIHQQSQSQIEIPAKIRNDVISNNHNINQSNALSKKESLVHQAQKKDPKLEIINNQSNKGAQGNIDNTNITINNN